MAEYQRIEYVIGKDGKVREQVLGGQGSGCLKATAGLEEALGQVEARTLLPEYEAQTVTLDVTGILEQRQE
jgi:hypothetical protein